jgi:hypothetical protein
VVDVALDYHRQVEMVMTSANTLGQTEVITRDSARQAATPSLSLQNPTGLLSLNGSDVTIGGTLSVGGSEGVSLTSEGDLELRGVIETTASGGDIVMLADGDLILSKTAEIRTLRSNARIVGNAGDDLRMEPGATVIAGLGTNTESVVRQLPPTMIVTPREFGRNVNIGEQNEAILAVGIGDPNGEQERGFRIDIDWGDGETDIFTTDPSNPQTPLVTREYSFEHQYLGNPGEQSTDPIDYQVTLRIDGAWEGASPRIAFTEGHGVDLTATTVTGQLAVPQGGLSYAVAFESPSIVTLVTIQNREFTESTVTQNALPQFFTEADVSNSSADSTATGTRQYVLRVVTPVDEAGNVAESEDVELKPDVLSNLADLFSRLEDDRYRIYLILEDGSEQLVKDIQVREHRASEVGEDDASVQAASAEEIPEAENAATESEAESTRGVLRDEQQVPREPVGQATLPLPEPDTIPRRNTALAIGVAAVLTATESESRPSRQPRDERDRGEERSLGRAVRRWRRGTRKIE